MRRARVVTMWREITFLVMAFLALGVAVWGAVSGGDAEGVRYITVLSAVFVLASMVSGAERRILGAIEGGK